MKLDDVKTLRELVITAAESAAKTSGCRMAYNFFEKSYHNMITNNRLSDLYNANAKAVGIDMSPNDENGGSIDMGNVSQVVPAIHPYYDITEGIKTAGHTVKFREATRTSFAYDAMCRTIEILAKTGYDIVTDPKLLSEIQDEFNQNK